MQAIAKFYTSGWLFTSFLLLSFGGGSGHCHSVRSASTKMAIYEAQADFALDLLRHATEENSSAIISPYSIAVALAMTYAGADGNTKEQMRKVLANGLDDEAIHGYFSELIADLAKNPEGYTLSSANRLYVNKGFALLDAYKAIISSKYGGQLESTDFSKPSEAANQINHWVEEQTRDKIKNLIKPSILSADTRLVLVNAVYFKGDWANQFKPEATVKKPFYVSENNEKEVDMMRMTHKFMYNEDDNVQVLGMPYKGQEVYMYVFLPKERYGLQKVQKELTGGKLLQLIGRSYRSEVIVEFPKFKLEKEFTLNEALNAMGIKDAFTTAADFSGMSQEPLYISSAIHKAFIEVNEEGTEAAAATGIVMNRMAAALPREKFRFSADHPFILALVKDDVLLFIARYM